MSNRPSPQFGVPLSSDHIGNYLPYNPIYGVTPDNKYIPVQINEDGQLSVGNVTITGPVTVNDVVIKGVDPNNGNTTEDIAVYNLGSGNGYAIRSTLFDGGNHLQINLDGSINTNITSVSGTIPVSIDHNLDSVAIYGTDGTSDQFVKTDSNGNLQTNVLSLPLPPNAAQETGGNLSSINFGLQTLNSLVPSVYDYIDLMYTGTNLTTVVFKTGGSGGTIVSTLNLTYSGVNLATVTRT